MDRLYRLIKRKKNVRRLLAAGFLFIAFIEIGSHAFMDSRDPDAIQAMTACSILPQNTPNKADCPDNQRNRGPESNLMDEMTSHAMILNTMTVPVGGIMYRTGTSVSAVAAPVFRALAPPFHPPEQT